MKTISGAGALKPMAEEEIIRFVFIGEENKPPFIGFEVPLSELSEQSLVQMREKISGSGRYTLIISVCVRFVPFEFSAEMARGTERLVSDVRIALINARDVAYMKRLVGIGDKLEEARKCVYKKF